MNARPWLPVLLIAALLFLQACRRADPKEEYTRAQTLAQKGDVAGAETALKTGLEAAKDSASRDQGASMYLDLLRSRLAVLDDSARTLRGKGQGMGGDPAAMKGTVSISYVATIALPERDSVRVHAARLAEEIIARHPEGAFRQRALHELLSLYHGIDSARHRAVAEALLNDPIPAVRQQARRVIATYAHAQGHFEEALARYAVLADSSGSPAERASDALLSADCYYHLGRWDDAIHSLRTMADFEKKNPNPQIHTVVEIWQATYEKAKKNGGGERGDLLSFTLVPPSAAGR